MKSKIFISGTIVFFFLFMLYLLSSSGAHWENTISFFRSNSELEKTQEVKFELSGVSLVDLKGRLIDFNILQNKVVILNFWASWCEPCIKEVPSLIKFSKKFNKKLIVVAISGDNDLAEVKAFLKSFPGLESENSFVVYEADKVNFNFFKINKLPESMIFDKNHKFIRKISGSIDWQSEDVEKYFESLVI